MSEAAFAPVPGWARLPHGTTFRGSATSVAVDRDDRVYVFNRGNRPMVILDRDGGFVSAWDDVQGFGRPHSVRIFGDDLYLVDDGAHVVEKRTLDGELVFRLGTPGVAAPKNSGEMFNRPTDLAVHPATGELFVSDGYANSRIHRFTPGGDHLLSWGEPGSQPGQFSVPHSLVVTADGRVVVCDRENFRIQVFDTEGTFLDQWHLHRPACIALDPAGELLYVGEHSPHRVQRFVPGLGCVVRILDLEGHEVGRFGAGTQGHADDELMDPHGLAVDSHGDVYVAEVCNSWIENLDVAPPLGEWPSLRKWVRTPAPETVTASGSSA
jgi:DNA-binding beta-propeller fold protein YncE